MERLVTAIANLVVLAKAEVRQRRIEGDRRPVSEVATILFTDLVSWTQISTTLRPDVAEELRRRHFKTLRRAIEDSEGTLVKGLGDGAMAVFPTASSALTSAVAMQRGVARDNRATGHPLGLRIGLSGGEVTREGADCFGDPVVEAARLCARAPSGAILATRVIKDIAGRRASHPCRSLGRLEFRGIPEPLETFEVDWQFVPSAALIGNLTVSELPAFASAPGAPLHRRAFGVSGHTRGSHPC